jgi:hypothetical protein
MAEVQERRRRVIQEAQAAARPKLLFVYSKTSGRSRRAEGFLAQVLQRRGNHETFRLIRVCAETHPQLVEQLQVKESPALLVIERRRVRARIVGAVGPREIKSVLEPWLK